MYLQWNGPKLKYFAFTKVGSTPGSLVWFQTQQQCYFIFSKKSWNRKKITNSFLVIVFSAWSWKTKVFFRKKTKTFFLFFLRQKEKVHFNSQNPCSDVSKCVAKSFEMLCWNNSCYVKVILEPFFGNLLTRFI